jgi:tRNA A37 threonylcarbamoyladenosine dehydratase
MDKAEAAAQRAKAINPDCDAKAIKTFYLPETAHQFDFTKYNYVVDAIDTVTGKLMLVQAAKDAGTPIISSMGTGNKLDPTAFEVTDINKTTFCPLARIMRKELKKRGIPHLKVVYSQEPAMTPGADSDEPVELSGRKPVPGSTAFVPAVAGLILAGEVIKDLTGVRNE